MANTWNINVNGAPHEVTFKSVFTNKLCVDGEQLPFKKLKTVREKGVFKTTVPVGGDEAYLYRFYFMSRLVYNGVDAATGEPYVPMKITPLAWVFIVLYVLSFFLVVGGALGAALDLIGVTYTFTITNDPKKSTGKKVLLCAGLFVLITAVGLAAAIGLRMLMYR